MTVEVGAEPDHDAAAAIAPHLDEIIPGDHSGLSSHLVANLAGHRASVAAPSDVAAYFETVKNAVRVSMCVLSATLGLSSCSSSSSPSQSLPSTAASSSDSRTTTAPAPQPSAAEGLEHLLIARVPAGFVQQADAVGDTGPSDLDKAVRDDGGTDARRVLTSDGFVAGYQRLWQAGASSQIIVFLYRFRTPAGAARYFTHNRADAMKHAPSTARTFQPAGLPTSDATGVAATVSGRAVAVVLAHEGNYVMQVDCNGPEVNGLKSRVETLAKDQYNRL